MALICILSKSSMCSYVIPGCHTGAVYSKFGGIVEHYIWAMYLPRNFDTAEKIQTENVFLASFYDSLNVHILGQVIWNSEFQFQFVCTCPLPLRFLPSCDFIGILNHSCSAFKSTALTSEHKWEPICRVQQYSLYWVSESFLTTHQGFPRSSEHLPSTRSKHKLASLNSGYQTQTSSFHQLAETNVVTIFAVVIMCSFYIPNYCNWLDCHYHTTSHIMWVGCLIAFTTHHT